MQYWWIPLKTANPAKYFSHQISWLYGDSANGPRLLYTLNARVLKLADHELAKNISFIMYKMSMALWCDVLMDYLGIWAQPSLSKNEENFTVVLCPIMSKCRSPCNQDAPPFTIWLARLAAGLLYSWKLWLCNNNDFTLKDEILADSSENLHSTKIYSPPYFSYTLFLQMAADCCILWMP